jgi:predicted nucleotidyltransferase
MGCWLDILARVIDLIQQRRDALLALCRQYDVRRLDVFGSALGPGFDPARSDLDFVVEFNNFTLETAADKFLGLMVDLEDLFGRRIDLVSYRAIHNPYFKQVVDETRVNLYAA